MGMSTLNTVFVSDLHYGDKRCNLEVAARMFGHIGSATRLVFVGDLLDSWACKTWELGPLAALLHGLVSDEIIVVRGNHDPANLQELLGSGIQVMDSYGITDSQGNAYKVMHGHQYDELLLKYDWLARWSFRMYEWIYTHWGWDLQKLRQFSVARRNNTAYFNNFAMHVLDEMRKDYPDVHGIICGHTHYPIRVKFNNKFDYINCGDLLESFSYVQVDSYGNINLCGYFPVLVE